MSDTTNTETPVTETPVEQTPVTETPVIETPAPEAQVEETPVEEQEIENKVTDELPVEVLRANLTAANKEAAGYRTRVRDAEKSIATLQAELKTERVAAIAASHRLEPELAALLKGETREELEAHAKELTKFSKVNTTPPAHLKGGLTPDAESGTPSDDPRARVRAIRRTRI